METASDHHEAPPKDPVQAAIVVPVENTRTPVAQTDPNLQAINAPAQPKAVPPKLLDAIVDEKRKQLNDQFRDKGFDNPEFIARDAVLVAHHKWAASFCYV